MLPRSPSILLLTILGWAGVLSVWAEDLLPSYGDLPLSADIGSLDDECSVSDGGCASSFVQLRANLHSDDHAASEARQVRSNRRRRGGSKPASGSIPQTLAGVVEHLWSVDAPYRLEPGNGYQLHQTAMQSTGSRSLGALFQYVDEAKLRQMPCTASFLALLDNFERETDKQETETSQERSEVSRFMEELMATPHMKYAYDVLKDWKSISSDYTAFGAQIKKIWMTQYSLGRGPIASSGFEHVFVGEEKYDKKSQKDTITGLHNWIQFWHEEKAHHIEYLGSKSQSGTHLVSARFEWKDDDPEKEYKSISTMLVGSSVPFEMAMLSVAFISFGGEAKVPGIYFGNEGPAQIVSYSWDSHGETFVRTAYLEA